MRNLRLPDGMMSVTVFDQTFGEPDGTVRNVEDHVAREILAHDPRITEFVEGAADDPAELSGARDRGTAFLARVASLDRIELFAVARSMQISMPATLKTEAMREIVIRHALTMNPDKLPMLIGSAGGQPAEGVKMLTPEQEADPNRGNDSLGQAGIHLTGRTGEGQASTIKQEVPAGSASVLEAFHAAVDEHEHNAADAIEVAAADLDLKVSEHTDPAPAKPAATKPKTLDQQKG